MAKADDIIDESGYSSRASKSLVLGKDKNSPASTANPLPVEMSGDIRIDAIEIKDATTDTRANVDWDGIYNALAVMDSRFRQDIDDDAITKSQNQIDVISLNYGFSTTDDYWTRFLTEQDDGTISTGLKPQLVVNLPYYYEDKSQAWKRWEGEDGYLYTYVTNFPDTDYRDDSSFTVGTERGIAIGGVATSDSVNPNDFGVLRITTDRSLVVTNDNITDGTQKSIIVDSDGDEINIKTNPNTTSNELLVNLEGHQCSENSTTDQLTADEVFLGSGWQDTLDYGVLSVNISTDQDSATDGLEIQWSNDGVNAADYDKFDVLANVPKTFTFGPAQRYYRIKYTNGSGGTTSGFHLTSLLRRVYVKPSSHRINDAIVGQDDAELVKAVLTAELPTGIFDNVNSTVNADGQAHLNTATIQKIITSTKNSTTTNLAAGATFTGTAEETFGVNGIQTYHYADQDCTIIIEQSIDGTNWDITDTHTCLANRGCTRSFQSVGPFFRAKVTNDGDSTTTIFRFACGMTPLINPLPRALTAYDRLKSESTLYDEVTDIRGKIAPFGKLKVVNPTRTIGTSFSGAIKDTNFWAETVTGSGSVAKAGDITLATGTTANSTAKYQSVTKSRHASGAANEFKFTGRLSTDPQANNIRRCGVYNGATGVSGDGFFFQVNGTTFGVGVRKGGTDTIVNSGSFNGEYGPNLSIDTSIGNFVIWWWERICYFFINGKLLHKISATTTSLVNTNTLPITMENINSGGNTTDNGFEILTASVFRLGNINTESISKYLTTGTHVLKYGAGVLKKIIVGDNVAGSVTVYDNTAASGTLLTVLDTAVGSSPLGAMDYNVPFSNGLTIVIVGTNKITVVYE